MGSYLKDSFAFYSAYHRNSINQLIHIITIPFIVLTILVWLSYATIYKFHFDETLLSDIFSINVGLIVVVVYLVFYIILDIVAGVLYIPFILIIYLLANVIRFTVPYAWLVAIIVHIVAWIFQFAGHGIWEKRKPALLDSLLQAFLMAPFFIFLEVLFKLGFKKEFKEEISELERNFLP